MTPLASGLIIGIFLFTMGAFAVFFRTLNNQVSDLRLEVRELATKVKPLWARVEARIASELHQPHPRYFEMDKLLEALDALTITEQERARLKVLLLERSQDSAVTDNEREKARFMILVMDMVLTEARDIEQK